MSVEIVFIAIFIITMLFLIGYVAWWSKEEDKLIESYYQTMFGYDD